MQQPHSFREVTGDKRVRIAFALVLGSSLLISTLSLAVSSRAVESGGGTYVHTVVQWLVVSLACLTMGLAMVHYWVRRDTAVLAIAAGLYFAGILELFHVLAADQVVLALAEPERLVPVTWAFSRIGKAVLLNGICLLFLLSVRERVMLRPATAWLLLLAGTAAFVVVGFFSVFMLSSGPTEIIESGGVLKRPWEVIGLCFYLLAAVLVFPQYYLRYRSWTALGLALSVVPDIFAQLHGAFGAATAFGPQFDAAVLFKGFGYLLPAVGLVFDYQQSYREEAEAVVKFRQAEQQLKTRLLELQQSTERFEQEEAERQSAEEAIRVLDRAIAASSCGIIITDPKVPGNQIIYVNPSFERIAGYSAEEAIGRGLDFLHAEDQEQPAAREMLNAVAEARDCRVILRNYRKDGAMFWSEVDIAPVPDENGMLTHYIGIMTDITDRIRAEEEHKKFTAKLELTNRELADFVHVASHDLQEPLRKVQVFGDRLRSKCEGVLPKGGLLYLERMQNSVRRMDQLIRDLLTYSRVGRKEQELSHVDLNAVVRDVLSDLEVRIEETQGEVLVGDLPTLEADATQMRQLLQNLIGNALKFHRPEAPPVVKIHSVPVSRPFEGQPVLHHQIFVEDNGIGFDEKYVERIFTVFQRLHTGNRYEGTGLGLTVCRKIVERHGGSIDATSQPGQGATFIVTLPASRQFAS